MTLGRPQKAIKFSLLSVLRWTIHRRSSSAKKADFRQHLAIKQHLLGMTSQYSICNAFKQIHNDKMVSRNQLS